MSAQGNLRGAKAWIVGSWAQWVKALLSDVLASNLLSQETFDYSCCLERKLYFKFYKLNFKLKRSFS